MKLYRSHLTLLLLLPVSFLWHCGPEDGPSGPGKVVIIPKDTTKPPDTVKVGPCGLVKCPDTVVVPIGLDTSALALRAATLAESGLNLGIDLVRSQALQSNRPAQWTAVPGDSDSAAQAWSVAPFGIYLRVSSQARVLSRGYEKRRWSTALIGQDLKLDDYPALGLTNHEGNMVLALRGEVEGPVMLWHGTVRNADYNAVRYLGRTRNVIVWDSTAAIWKSLPIPFARTEAWMERRAQELDSIRVTGKVAADEAFERTEIVADGFTLSGHQWENTRFYCAGSLTLGAGAVFRDCQIVAATLRIGNDARFQGGAVMSLGRMEIQGSPVLSGQFLSGDTLVVNIASTLEDCPVFYVSGKADINSQRGMLHIANAQGRGIFLFQGNPELYGSTSLALDAGTDLGGFAYTTAFMDIRGYFRGSILGKNLYFYLSPTIYLGHFAYAHCALAPVGAILPFGAVWEGVEPKVIARLMK